MTGLDSDLNLPFEFVTNYLNQSKKLGLPTTTYSDFILVFNTQYEQTLTKPSNPVEQTRVDQSSLQVLKKLIDRINKAGLILEKSDFEDGKLALFVTCPRSRLLEQYIVSRTHDYLHGMRVADIDLLKSPNQKDLDNINLSSSERIRLVYEILTNPIIEGGADIAVLKEPYIDCLYPVHDRDFNKRWLKLIVLKWRINESNLTLLKDHFGHEIAFYFAFLNYYFDWLILPSILGLTAHLFLDIGSTFYGITILIWSTMFIEGWSRTQSDLAVKWDAHNASKVEKIRPDFKGSYMKVDPISNELIPEVPVWHAWLKKFASIPIIIILGSILTFLVMLSFIIELIITDYYQGPFKMYLSVLPGLIYFLLVTNFSTLYNRLAHKLTQIENHRTESDHSYYLTQKVFIVNFLGSYLSIFLVAWVYIPYGDEITELIRTYLSLTGEVQKIGLERLQTQLMFFVVTAQLINFITETIVPIIIRYGGRTARSAQHKAQVTLNKLTKNDDFDSDEEEELLGDFHLPTSPTTSTARMNNPLTPEMIKRSIKKFKYEYLELVPYTTYDDYVEMVTQFGYITLFSTVFPYAAIVSFLNNWVELRSDSFKIVMTHRRVIPTRVENIGAWQGNLTFIVWLSSITTGLLTFQFSNLKLDLEGYHLLSGLITAILWEHLWLLFITIVRTVSSNIPTWSEGILRQETFELKKKVMAKVNRV